MRFDTVIVGCGTTGSMLASYLSADPSRSVCAIEAGQDYPTIADVPRFVREAPERDETTSDLATTGSFEKATASYLVGTPWNWGFTARSTDLSPRIELQRGKLVGGSAAINGCTWLWPVREDLDAWVKAGNDNWRYEDCLPYLASIEHDIDYPGGHHGANGPIRVNRPARSEWLHIDNAFLDACKALGFPECADFNAPDAVGVGPLPKNFDDSDQKGVRVRQSTALGYLLPARSRSNLSIIADSLATRIVITGGKARGVEVMLNGTPTVIEADEVILTAGAVGSPQLLMLSGIGPAAHLQSLGITPILDRPGVGQNLRDHPRVIASWSAEGVEKRTAKNGNQMGLRASVPGSNDGTDMQVSGFPNEGTNRFSLPFWLMHAESAGELRLTSADPSAAPDVDFRYFNEKGDLTRMTQILELLDEIVAQPPFGKYRPTRIVPEPAESAADWIMSTAITGHHISGTCKMGQESDPLAVVDEQGRLYGIESLRVIDSSILVDCPRSNTNAMVMMVAEKIAKTMLVPERVG